MRANTTRGPFAHSGSRDLASWRRGSSRGLARSATALAGALLALALAPLSAEAQALPPPLNRTEADVNNPRALERFETQEREDALREAGAPAIAGRDAAAEAPAAPAGAESVRFVLRKLLFGESRVLTTADLDMLAKPYVGRTISVADLFRITAEVNDLYRRRGYVTAQAVLAPQDIKDGAVRIDLVEGTIGEVVVSGNKRVRSDFVIESAAVRPGTIPTIDLLERRVSAVNFNRNFQVTAGLRPGREPLTTDLTLDVAGERKPVTASLYVDNNGTEANGLYSLGGIVGLYSFLGYDEVVTLGGTTSFNHVEDVTDLDVSSAFVDAVFPIPLNNGNFRFLYSHSNSAVLEGDFASLGIDGRGDVVSSTVTVPFYTDATTNLAVLGGHQYSRTRSTVGIVDTDTSAQRLFAGVSGQTTLPEAEIFLDGELRVVQSWVDVWGLAGRENETVTRIVGDLTAYRGWESGWSVQSRLAGQYTPDERLPSGELWYMGGAFTLPAYELSSISGDGGFVLSSQARYTSAAVNDALAEALRVPVTIGARAFFDVGGVYDDFVLPRDSDIFADYGLGLDFSIDRRLTGDFTVAWPVDADNDPSLSVKNPRFLFSVTTTF